MNTKINLRIHRDDKAKLEELASAENQTLSNYLRDLLSEHICDNSVDIKLPLLSFNIDIPSKKPVKGYEQTFEFTSLFAWLLARYINPRENNSVEDIKAVRAKVESVINNSVFTKELKEEFVKVLHDLNRYLMEPNLSGKYFMFPMPGNTLSFDYNRLMDDIWAIEEGRL